eukprot:13236473-Alexandrium_andersonii.AAC.1
MSASVRARSIAGKCRRRCQWSCRARVRPGCELCKSARRPWLVRGVLFRERSRGGADGGVR